MVVVICEQPPCRVMCAAPQKRKIKFMLKVIGLALAVAIVASFSGAATPAQAGTYTPIAMTMVRSDIPSIEAYWSDHNTYVGITVAKLRAYDSGLSSIEIVRARKTTFCVQTNVLGSWAHYAGPSGIIRAGRC